MAFTTRETRSSVLLITPRPIESSAVEVEEVEVEEVEVEEVEPATQPTSAQEIKAAVASLLICTRV
jgi:hypothetical protein